MIYNILYIILIYLYIKRNTFAMGNFIKKPICTRMHCNNIMYCTQTQNGCGGCVTHHHSNSELCWHKTTSQHNHDPRARWVVELTWRAQTET